MKIEFNTNKSVTNRSFYNIKITNSEGEVFFVNSLSKNELINLKNYIDDYFWNSNHSDMLDRKSS